MFKQVVYNTYIGKSKLSLISEGKSVDNKTKIGEISYPLTSLKGNSKYPDYYIRGLYLESTEEDPAEFFQIVKPYKKCTHCLCITGIPKGALSLNPYRLQDCLWSSYYEDDLHGFLFQIVKNEVIKLKE